MDPNDKHKHQRKFIAARKAEGLERLILWVKPEDKVALKEIARQPHAIAKRRAAIEAEIRQELGPQIERRVAAELTRKTRRALLAQRRARARRLQTGSNRPPEMIRFAKRPPGRLRNRLKAQGWDYDPVAAVWHLPDELDAYDIERLAEPLD